MTFFGKYATHAYCGCPSHAVKSTSLFSKLASKS